ncbi:MAG TPA: alpha-hydroxy acid oxidase [Nocardioides sp.]|nr:alpha-hydroxy acid oxidase [Nocardioides sp.]
MDLEPAPAPPRRWLDALPDAAKRAIRPAVWAYIQAGAGEGLTAAEAGAAWREVRFRTRVLRGGGGADLRTTMLGSQVASPIGIAPTAMQRAVHPAGERAMAEGVGAGTLHVVSSNCGTRFDELGAAGPWWLQAYLPPQRDLFRPVVDAAVAAGAQAVVLTVDTPYPGTKYGVDEEDWSSIDLGWWRTNYPEGDVGDWKTDLTLDDVGWLREAAGVPVVVKGVLRGDDALRCLDAGADAIYVSNHGGRQLDRSISSATALREVVASVAGRAEVYVDGGIRSGADVLAALALGARGVLVGRPAVWALGLEGAEGVARLLADLGSELTECLELAGCSSPAEAADLP